MLTRTRPGPEAPIRVASTDLLFLHFMRGALRHIRTIALYDSRGISSIHTAHQREAVHSGHTYSYVYLHTYVSGFVLPILFQRSVHLARDRGHGH